MAKKKKKKSFGTKNTYSRNDTVPMSFYHEEDNTFEEQSGDMSR